MTTSISRIVHGMSCLVAPALLSACSTGVRSTDPSLARARSGFFEVWTKGPEPFDVSRLQATLVDRDAAEEFLSFDGMNASKTVIEGTAQYLAIWKPGMDQFRTATLSEARVLRSWQSGDLGVTCSIVRVQGEMGDGTRIDMPGHITLVWRRVDGDWRVLHEHMSLGVKE